MRIQIGKEIHMNSRIEMKRLREIIPIQESRWRDYLYHGGDGDPKEIRPGYHLGTLAAAKDRIKSRKPKDPTITAYEYRPGGRTIDVDDDSGNLKTTSDDELAKHAGLLTRIKHRLRSVGKQFQSNGDPDVYSGLKKKGITTARYKNAVENPGSVSTIVFDPENLRRVHTFHRKEKSRER